MTKLGNTGRRWGVRSVVRLVALAAVGGVGGCLLVPEPDPMLVTVGRNPVAYSPGQAPPGFGAGAGGYQGAVPMASPQGGDPADAPPPPLIVPAYTAPIYGPSGPLPSGR